jgi:hypothetical protein
MMSIALALLGCVEANLTERTQLGVDGFQDHPEWFG